MLVTAKLAQTVEIDDRTQREIAVATIRKLFNLPEGVYIFDGDICYAERVSGHNSDTERHVLRKHATPGEKAALMTIDVLEKHG